MKSNSSLPFCSHPSRDISVMDQREHERYLVEFPVTFAGDCEGAGIIYNLGMGGCKVVTDRPLVVGSMLALYLNVPNQTFAITVRMATVRWTMQYDFGVEFLGMEEIERERLGRFLQGLAAAAA
jgi:PilZ domain-containing protein